MPDLTAQAAGLPCLLQRELAQAFQLSNQVVSEEGGRGTAYRVRGLVLWGGLGQAEASLARGFQTSSMQDEDLSTNVKRLRVNNLLQNRVLHTHTLTASIF